MLNSSSVPKAHIKGGVMLAVSFRCGHCNRQKLPSQIATGDDKRGRVCWDCLVKHYRNITAIATNRPRRCNECRVSFDELARRDESATMTVQVKDGILQLLCKPCALRYEPKSHVYKNTGYAHAKKFHSGVK